MEHLIFGAGRMGMAVTYDIIRSKDYNTVTVVDRDKKSLENLVNLTGRDRVKTVHADLSDSPRIMSLMDNAQVAIGAASYTMNATLTSFAIGSQTHFCDLGGNPNVVKRQFELDAKAKKAGVVVIPDCGLAPGMMSILVGDAMKDLVFAEDIKLRVGGLPQNPRGMLKYMIVFSPEGLINEYIEDADVIKDGVVSSVKGMSGLEKIGFKGFPALEAFYTGGGTSTLPETYSSRVMNLDYKTIRYSGHCEKMKKLLSAFDVRAGGENRHRKEFERILENAYSFDDKDLVLARAVVRGKYKTISYEIIDHEDEKSGLTAMMRTTGFPVSIIAQMMASGEISQRGVRPQESAVPSKEFIYQMRERGVGIEKKVEV